MIWDVSDLKNIETHDFVCGEAHIKFGTIDFKLPKYTCRNCCATYIVLFQGDNTWMHGDIMSPCKEIVMKRALA